MRFEQSSSGKIPPIESPPCLDNDQLSTLAALLDRAVGEGLISIGKIGSDSNPEIASTHELKVATDGEGVTLLLSKREIRRLSD